jgi:hypothetical protein
MTDSIKFGPNYCTKCNYAHGGPCVDHHAWIDKLFGPATPRPETFETISTTIYRDIFAEITAKAIPHTDPESDDPEMIDYYTIPVGPIHRAAGKVGFQMFDGGRPISSPPLKRLSDFEHR